MNQIQQFQHLLLTDHAARKAFAANPGGFLKQHNITMPQGTRLPLSINEAQLETAVATVNKNVTSAQLSGLQSNPAAVSKLVEKAFPSKATKADLTRVSQVMGEGAFLGHAGDAATAAAVAVAVVAAVVAVPVAVFGFVAQGEEAE